MGFIYFYKRHFLVIRCRKKTSKGLLEAVAFEDGRVLQPLALLGKVFWPDSRLFQSFVPSFNYLPGSARKTFKMWVSFLNVLFAG